MRSVCIHHVDVRPSRERYFGAVWVEYGRVNFVEVSETCVLCAICIHHVDLPIVPREERDLATIRAEHGFKTSARGLGQQDRIRSVEAHDVNLGQSSIALRGECYLPTVRTE